MRVADKPTKETYRQSSRIRNRPVPVLKRVRSAKLKTSTGPGQEPVWPSIPEAASLRVAKALSSFIRTGPVVSIHVTTRHGQNGPRKLFTIPYRGLLAAVLLFVLCASLWVSVRRTQADVAVFAPATCLGGWANPTQAQGDVQKGELLESSNSAMYAGGQESLYCGNFMGSNIDGVEIQSASLRLIWGQVEAPAAVLPGEYIDSPALQQTDDTPSTPNGVGKDIEPVQTEQNSNTETLDIKPAEPDSVDSTLPATQSDVSVGERVLELVPEVKGESQSVESPNQEAAPPSEQSTAPSEPQSYIPKLVKTAHAQENADTTSAAAKSANVPVSEVSDTFSTEVKPQVHAEVFSLRYSLDGATWTEFGRGDLENFNAEFTLPLQSAADVRALQVGVIPINSTNLERPILLNGMLLELRYVARDAPTAPNPEMESLLSVQSAGSVSLVKTQDAETQQVRLWVYDREGSPQWVPVAVGNEIEVGSLTLLVSEYAFWVSQDGRSLSAYNLKSKTYFSRSITEPSESDESAGLSFGDGKTVQLLAGRLVLRDSEGIIEPVDSEPELDAEVEGLFKAPVSLSATKDDRVLDTAAPAAVLENAAPVLQSDAGLLVSPATPAQTDESVQPNLLVP